MEEEEELIWWTVYKDLVTSTGTEKNRIPKFQSRMLQYATVRILCNWNRAYIFATLGM